MNNVSYFLYYIFFINSILFLKVLFFIKTTSNLFYDFENVCGQDIFIVNILDILQDFCFIFS